MVRNIDDMQQLGKDNMDATMKSFGAVSKSLQAIAVEMADYSKKVFEQGSRRDRETHRCEVARQGDRGQSDYAKNAYEGFVAEATKLGELYADLAKEAYKPFETHFGKVGSLK